MDRDHEQVAKATSMLTDRWSQTGASVSLTESSYRPPMPHSLLHHLPSPPPHYLLSSGPMPQSSRGWNAALQPAGHALLLSAFLRPKCGCSSPILQPNLSACSNLNNIFSCRDKKWCLAPPFMQMQHASPCDVECYHIL